ncbi:MAG: 50S ribosomal protein L35 [Actinobacteria bacterium]|nr:MAG: 50S ribosomal protein L35 [Actinomycetota bacterium]
MPKKKTHKGAAKRFKETGTGKLMHARIGHSHILEKKSPKRKRKLRGEAVLGGKHAKNVKSLIK